MDLVYRMAELIKEQQAELERLQKLVRAGKRSAAPFSNGKGKPDDKKKKPGRKAGQGSYGFRPAPKADEVTHHEEAHVGEECCPECGGELDAKGFEDVWITDIPEMPRPVVRHIQMQVCSCRQCGRRVRARLPDVAEDQRGATAHRVGPRAMAAAHVLHYEVGIPQQKVPRVLKELTGISVTQGAVSQHAMRTAEQGPVADLHQQLRNSIKESPVVYTDDTGWREGGKPAQLMVFDTDEATVYQIRPQHRNQEVRELVPSDYDGKMVTDRGPSYDAKELDEVKQQKCNAHVLRSIDAVLDKKKGNARTFGLELKRLIKESIQLWKDYRAGKQEGYKESAAKLKEQVTHHLRPRKFADPDNRRLLKELGWHHGRGNLVRYLEDPIIEPTNNRAERAIRPAVIARKVSQCTKSPRGSMAHAAYCTVVNTLKKLKSKTSSLVDELTAVLRGNRLEAPAQPAGG